MSDFPDESINCCISSPPYWALRDYGVDGQLGLEPTFEEYIDKLCSYYDEVYRILRKDGTCWVNLGDTYASSPAGNREIKYEGDGNYGRLMARHTQGGTSDVTPKPKKYNVPTKSLCCIPDRFRIEMINRGWILRNKIIWSKPNPMPSSAKDRFTVDFEDVMFFVKSQRYFFEPQYELHTRDWSGCGGNLAGKGKHKLNAGFEDIGDRSSLTPNPLGRNKRTTWIIPTQPTPEAHFATFPEELVRPMVKAGCPRYVCKKCGKPRVKVYDMKYVQPITRGGTNISRVKNQEGYRPDNIYSTEHYFKGYTDCGCNAGWIPGIVLDPFCGTGRACKVAAKEKCNYIGIDIKNQYVEQFAKPNVNEAETGVTITEQRQGQMPLF